MRLFSLLKTGVLLQILLKLLPAAAAERAPHFDLELTGSEYRAILMNHQKRFLTAAEPSSSARQLQPVLDAGVRNLELLKHLNSGRPEAPLSLSGPDSQAGYPVDSPRIYNVTIVLDSFSKLRQQVPASIAAIVLDGAPFTADLGMSDENYILSARLIDGVYQLASRWLLLEPYLGQLAWKKKSDVRSYVALSSGPDLTRKLSRFELLSPAEQQSLLKGLFEICFNSPSMTEAICRSELAVARSAKNLHAFYSKHLPAAAQVYSSFFAIPTWRSDVLWPSSAPLTMTVPFADPGNATILHFLRENIEDEWKWNGWSLRLDFRSSGSVGMTQIRFVPGATPHVDRIAGNTITMDSNTPLTEYNVQWTIRHEYGHVLGFPDCYHEFWDSDLRAMVSYQLDTTNLMCSRRGKLKETHYLELRRVYLKSQE
ncbi:MAG: hypothetical protein RJB38_1750 [Pseudomonadota bacterium]|jgi:hypothetical protein